jgi:hypothetical protein
LAKIAAERTLVLPPLSNKNPGNDSPVESLKLYWEHQRMQIAKFGMGLLLLVLTAGVAQAQKITSDYDPTGDFDSYKTFMWIQRPQDESRAEIQRAVASELTAKGWRQVSEGADIGVAANVANQKDRSLETFYSTLQGWNWRRWDQSDTSSSDIQRFAPGTVVVDLFDAKKRRVVWRGIATGVYSAKGGGDHADKDLHKMFKSFPPRWNPMHQSSYGGS